MTPHSPEDSRDQEGPERPSKSARKREAHAAQDLGETLIGLRDAELEALDLPERLIEAIREARRITSRAGGARQRQYIGKLMRQIDPEPVLAKLAERKERHDSEIRHFQRIERWRDRLLCEPETALPLLCEEYPRADREALARILKKAGRERLEQRPPAGARELFAFLRQLLE